MADVIITNERPLSPSPWYGVYRLVEVLLATGTWTIKEMSDGVTVGNADNWTGRYLQQYNATGAATSWIILSHATIGNVCFRRKYHPTHYVEGWIVWSKGGGFSAGGTVAAPANIPADAAFIRGTGTPGTPGVWTTPAIWFCCSGGMEYINIGARGAGAEASFWFAGKAYNNAKWFDGTHHWLALEELQGTELGDTMPYAWSCTASATGTWGAWNSQANWQAVDNAAGNAGVWKRWWNAGQAGEAFKHYAAGVWFQQGTATVYAGMNPPHEATENQLIYSATPREMAQAIKLYKTQEAAFQDGNGGYTKNILMGSPSLTPSERTFGGGAWTKLGSYLTVWWDGDPTNPPRD